MVSRLKVYGLVGAVLALTLASLVPVASAQAVADVNVAVHIDPSDQPIKPLSGLLPLKITVQYTYSSAGGGLVATPVHLKVTDQPNWAVVTITPATIYMPVLQQSQATGGASTTTETLTATMLISATQEAPAFQTAAVKVQAVADANGNLKGNTGEDQTLIRADFFSIIDAQATSGIQISGPQTQVSFPIQISNFGNAQTKFFFTVTSAPDGWNIKPPEPTILESKQQGGKTTTATSYLTVLSPYHNGYLNLVGAITMKIDTKYALDPKLIGDSSQVSVILTDKGFYVPGPGLLGVLAALGGAFLVFGTRRRRER